MRKGTVISVLGAALMAGTALAPAEPANAQIRAFLPNKETVAETEPMEIDGDWRVNTIGKVIRIERGRAYAVEGWTHAFVLRVQPDMVTIRNIQQTGDKEYVGDDLPMMGRVTLQHVEPDRIEASVPGLFGLTRYTLTRVAGSGHSDGNDAAGEPPPMFATFDGPEDGKPGHSPAPDRGPAPSYTSLAEAFGEPRPIAETFRGCEIPAKAVRELSASTPPPTPRDRVTGRQFAPVADSDPMPDLDAECWTRLDGVWVENREPIFNTALNDGSEWEVENTPLAGLLHGNYTTPETLFVAPGDDPENELFVMSGTNGMQFARYVSADGTGIADLIGTTGVSKVFEPVGDVSYGDRLTIDYTAGGDLRIRLGERQFLRPPPAVSNDLSMDDAFVIQFQTDNFAANLKGYNVLTQDPFFLMDNDLGEVFARRDREDYRIQEKYAVPFGFTLRNELLQGNVYRRTIVSSEKQIQETTGSAFGLNANLSVSGAMNSVLSFLPGGGEIADTGLSVGQQSTRETMRAMRNSRSVAQVVGYSRAKSYAIVAEHADLKLSDDFLTAVVDAKHDGDFGALIRRFGTHYAYAVTYGANAKMTQDISEEAFQTVLAETEGDHREAEARYLGSSIGGFDESMRSGVDETSGQIGNEGGRFVAVGGNGSWDSGGYARGDRVAPILLDLRPLDELLNPINFPDQPDIYTRVRAELAQSINRYLAGQARPLSNERLISKVTYVPLPPEPEPLVEEGPPIEEWHVYVRRITCLKPGIGTTNAAFGDISISAVGPTNGFAQSKELRVKCERKSAGSKTYSYRISPNTPGLMILRGTREQMNQYLLNFDFNWRYQGAVRGKGRNDQRSLNTTPLQTGRLSVGQSDTTKWVIGPKGRPEVTLYLRVKRIK